MTNAGHGGGRPIGPVLVAVGVLACAVLVAFEAVRLGAVPVYGGGMGPAAFPWGIALGLAALGVGNLVVALRGLAPAGEPMDLTPALWVVGGLLGQILLLIPFGDWLSLVGVDPIAAGLPFDPDLGAGFSIATGVLFGLTARGFGKKPLWLTIPIGIVLSFLIYLVFVKGLQLSLPAGPLESLI